MSLNLGICFPALCSLFGTAGQVYDAQISTVRCYACQVSGSLFLDVLVVGICVLVYNPKPWYVLVRTCGQLDILGL